MQQIIHWINYVCISSNYLLANFVWNVYAMFNFNLKCSQKWKWNEIWHTLCVCVFRICSVAPLKFISRSQTPSAQVEMCVCHTENVTLVAKKGAYHKNVHHKIVRPIPNITPTENSQLNYSNTIIEINLTILHRMCFSTRKHIHIHINSIERIVSSLNVDYLTILDCPMSMAKVNISNLYDGITSP